MVQHLQIWEYVALSGNSDGKYIEYVDQQHEHFVDTLNVQNAKYIPPTGVGYSTTFKPETLAKYEYPNGTEWEALFAKGLYPDPRKYTV